MIDDDLPAFEKMSKRKRRHTMSGPKVTNFPTCSGKKSFTKERAVNTARALMNKHGVDKDLRAYRCPISPQHWHLTSMSRDKYRRYASKNRG